MKIPNIRLRRAGSAAGAARRGFGAAGWGVAGLLAVALTAGGAYAATTGGSSLPATDSAATAAVVGKNGANAAGALAKLGKRVEHADAVVRTKSGPESILMQRGTIASIAGSTIAVNSLDGWTGTWTLNDATHYRADGSVAAMSTLKVGDRVFVAGAGQGNSGTAQLVRDPGPAKAGKGKKQAAANAAAGTGTAAAPSTSG